MDKLVLYYVLIILINHKMAVWTAASVLHSVDHDRPDSLLVVPVQTSSKIKPAH